MQVRNKVFYHLHTVKHNGRIWKQGKRIVFKNDQGNNFSRYRFADLHRLSGEIKKGAPYLKNVITDLKEYKDILDLGSFSPAIHPAAIYRKAIHELIKKQIDLHDVVVTYMRFINELLFERVRKNEFPHLPSRMNCVWLSEKRSMKRWVKMLKSDMRWKIFKISVNGDVHKVDGSWIEVDIYTASEIYDRAHSYWSGKLHADPKKRLIEHICLGEISVLEDVTDDYTRQASNW